MLPDLCAFESNKSCKPVDMCSQGAGRDTSIYGNAMYVFSLRTHACRLQCLSGHPIEIMHVQDMASVVPPHTWRMPQVASTLLLKRPLLSGGRRITGSKRVSMHPAPLKTAMGATAMADMSLTVPVTDTGMTGMTGTQAQTQAGTMATNTTKIEAETAAETAAGIVTGIAAGIAAGIGIGTGIRAGPGVSHGIAAAGRVQVPP